MNTKKIIMRRVYYSYLLSIFSRVAFAQGLFLGVAGILLGRWLHVASLYKNFLAVPVGNIPSFITGSYLNAINHGEILMVMMFTVATIVSLSSVYRLIFILATINPHTISRA